MKVCCALAKLLTLIVIKIFTVIPIESEKMQAIEDLQVCVIIFNCGMKISQINTVNLQTEKYTCNYEDFDQQIFAEVRKYKQHDLNNISV